MTDEPLITVTEADIGRLAPKAKREYVTAILGNLSQMRSAGILENELRWCHFIAQCAHETGGFTIIRESLHYKSVARIREVWPARFKSWSDAEVAKLVGNPVALGDAVYGGRMGNKAPGDGCAYRGAGPLQTTGRGAVAKYAGALGLDCTPEILDDCGITMQFAILEWQQSGCNKWADANDLEAVSKTINVGSATSGVTPVGMNGRRECFAKAWGIWGGKGKPDKPAKPPMTVKETLLKVGAPIAGGVEVTRQGISAIATNGVPAVPEVATKSLQNVQAWKQIGTGVKDIGTEAVAVVAMTGRLWPYAVGAGVGGAVLAFAIWKRRDAEKAG